MLIKNYIMLKKTLFSFLIIFIHAGLVSAESNFEFFFKNSSQYQDVVIDDISSTDRIYLKAKTGEKREVIKLIGLKAPKAPKRKKVDLERDEHNFVIDKVVSPMTPIEEKAYEYVRELLVGQHVRLEFDNEKISEDHETLAYVFFLKDNTLVNSEILRQGFAHLQIRPPNSKYNKELREAYKEARAEKRGLQGE